MFAFLKNLSQLRLLLKLKSWWTTNKAAWAAGTLEWSQAWSDLLKIINGLLDAQGFPNSPVDEQSKTETETQTETETETSPERDKLETETETETETEIDYDLSGELKHKPEDDQSSSETQTEQRDGFFRRLRKRLTG